MSYDNLRENHYSIDSPGDILLVVIVSLINYLGGFGTGAADVELTFDRFLDLHPLQVVVNRSGLVFNFRHGCFAYAGVFPGREPLYPLKPSPNWVGAVQFLAPLRHLQHTLAVVINYRRSHDVCLTPAIKFRRHASKSHNLFNIQTFGYEICRFCISALNVITGLEIIKIFYVVYFREYNSL